MPTQPLDLSRNPTVQDFFRAGYQDLISVIPPDGHIDPNSAITDDQRGKCPGRRTEHGTYVGYDWRAAPAITDADVMGWGSSSVGLRTDRFPAIDIDCMDAELAHLIERCAREVFGPAPVRIGRAPKRLLLYRTRTPMRRQRLWLGDGHLIEVLGAGQQCVVAGVHPNTGKPYRWPEGIERADGLTEITPDMVDQFLATVEDTLDMLGILHSREGRRAAGARVDVDQRSLRSSLAHVRTILAELPNDNDSFPNRSDYIALGYAVKAAVGEDGWFVFRNWALKWPGNDRYPGGNDEVTVRRDWARFKPPYEVGVDYLDSLHRQFTTGGTLTPDFVLDTPTSPQSAPPQAAQPPTAATLPAPQSASPIAFSEAHLAEVLAERCAGEVLYLKDTQGWMAWDGRCWSDDSALTALHRSGQVCLEYSALALASIKQPNKAESTSMRLAGYRCKRSVLDYCADRPEMQSTLDVFDSDLLLLNTPAAVIDLRDGRRAPHAAARMMTRITAVSPADGPAPLWAQFLRDTTKGDKDLEHYLQRLAGYALTGETREAVVAFLYGGGGNGKSVFLDALMACVGGYGRVSSGSTFAASSSSRHPVELADLAGARLVVAQETRKGVKWDEERLKSLTGGGAVTARFMYGNLFAFTPRFTLIFSGNDMPELDGLDPAMKRRLHIVPFVNTPAHPDKELPAKLRDEYPQILQWMVEGVRMWLDEGLAPPENVAATTADYFDDEDPFGRWAEASLELAPKGQPLKDTKPTLNKVLFENWCAWCGANHVYPGKAQHFGRKLARLEGVQRWRDTSARGWLGLRIVAGIGADNEAGEPWA